MKIIILYTTKNPCPNCRLLKEYLDKNNINYNIITDIQLMIDKGFKNVPVLEIDDKIYDRLDTAMMAIKEINNIGE